MAYITKEQVAEKRAKLKAAFPAKDGWKLSVRSDSSSLTVTFVEGPIDFKVYNSDPEGYSNYPNKIYGEKLVDDMDVNHYYLDDSRYPRDVLEVLKKANDIMHEGHQNNSDIQSDYFDVSWYNNLKIGNWDKKYKKVTK